MSLFRRLFGGGDRRDTDESSAADTAQSNADAGGSSSPVASAGSVEDEELARDRELRRAEQERLDELQQRQLRYSEYAWTPPKQGGELRAEDADSERRD